MGHCMTFGFFLFTTNTVSPSEKHGRCAILVTLFGTMLKHFLKKWTNPGLFFVSVRLFHMTQININ